MIRENLQVLMECHPFYESLNRRILEQDYDLIYNPLVSGYNSNVIAHRTLGDLNTEGIKLVKDWILTIIKQHYPVFEYSIEGWIAKYNKGDHTLEHDHIPAGFSFVYFVKTPKGSSPLVFSTSGKRIKAEEGKLVIFPACMRHHVPKNRCDERVTFAGNVSIINNS